MAQTNSVERLLLPPVRGLVERIPGITVHPDPYAAPFEPYHHQATRAQTWDIVAIEAIVARHGGPVLDIGCGRGRLALRLAAAGRSITAVDTSACSLTHLRQAANDPDLGGRIEARLCDITNTQCIESGRFRVVALADLSINIFASETAIGQLLRAARDAMDPDGVFCVPVLHPDSMDSMARLRGTTAVPFTTDQGQQRLLWLVLHYRPDGPYFERTLFALDDNAPDGSIRGDVTAVRERLWTSVTLRPHLAAVGLGVVRAQTLDVPSTPGHPLLAELLTIRRI